MTLPAEQRRCAGKGRLERGGLERDELLKLLWTQLTKLHSAAVFSFLIHIDIRPLKMHVLYAFCF